MTPVILRDPKGTTIRHPGFARWRSVSKCSRSISMKTLVAAFVLLLVTLTAAFGADIDGKWKSERKMDRNGESMTIIIVFDLKADGSKLTGKLKITSPRGDREADVADG